MNNLKVLKSKNEDIVEIAEIYLTEFSKPPYNEEWTNEVAINKIKFFNEHYDLYTLWLDQTIIGFICVNPKFMCPGEVAFGEEIAIKEEFQNKGIGTEVFKEIFSIYKKKGFKRFLGISNINSDAKHLYNKLGFVPAKEDVLIEKEF